MKALIVNADDFGLSPGVNQGIAQAHAQGVVTTTSLMVRWPAAEEAAGWARAHPSLGVGMHFDLGEWACSDGEWRCLYKVVSPHDEIAVAQEMERQLDTFRRLMGRNPTHLDSHQHVHRWDGVREVAAEAAQRLRIPLRHFVQAIRYCGEFYGQTGNGSTMPEAITVESLIAVLERLLPGVTELACHPATAADFESMYRNERLRELETLCDPRIKAALVRHGIQLTGFEGRAFDSPETTS